MIRPADRLSTVKEYYFSTKLREVRGLMQQGKPIINMGIGSPDLAPDPAVLQELQEAIRESGAHQYQGYKGLPELREAMADFYSTKFQVSLNPDSEVLPLMGSKEGIMHISMAFLNPGDQVLIPNPGYPTYRSVSELVGAETLTYDLYEENNWFPDLDALDRTDLRKVKLMWVSYPHMPTGARASQQQLQTLVDFAVKHNILLVNDNPYSFVLAKNPISILKTAGGQGRILELNSLSKTFNMAGWRVGMLLGDADLVETVLKVKSNMDSGMFYGIQKGAIRALSSANTWYEKLNEIYQERRNWIFKLADALDCTYDPEASGMFVWARLPENQPDSEAFIDRLLHEQHIFVAPGTIFGSRGAGYIRFSLCVPVAAIQEALERVRSHSLSEQNKV